MHNFMVWYRKWPVNFPLILASLSKIYFLQITQRNSWWNGSSHKKKKKIRFFNFDIPTYFYFCFWHEYIKSKWKLRKMYLESRTSFSSDRFCLCQTVCSTILVLTMCYFGKKINRPNCKPKLSWVSIYCLKMCYFWTLLKSFSQIILALVFLVQMSCKPWKG